jgi:hypothetical protein
LPMRAATQLWRAGLPKPRNAAGVRLANQTFASWNRITYWLRQRQHSKGSLTLRAFAGEHHP